MSSSHASMQGRPTEPKLNVAMVLNSFIFGGVEEHSMLLSSTLPENGYNPVVIYKDAPELQTLSHRLDQNGIKRISYDTISGGAFTQLISAWRLAGELRKMNVDLLHVQLVSHYGGRVPLLAGMLARIPTVVTHHIAPEEKTSKLQQLMRLPFIGNVRQFIAVSEENRRLQVENGGLPSSKTVSVPNGIVVPAEAADRKAAHERLCSLIGAPKDATIVGAVGRLSEQKGLKWLLAAIPGILERSPNAHFVFVGDGELREELQNQAAELGLAHRIIWLGFRSDVPQLLPGLDVLAMPSLYEGLPMVLLEAMAAETPVVAHSVSGIPEVIEDGVSGFLTEIGDVEEFAKRISSLLNNPQMAEHIGQQARQRILSGFSVSAMAQRTASVYNQVMAKAA